MREAAGSPSRRVSDNRMGFTKPGLRVSLHLPVQCGTSPRGARDLGFGSIGSATSPAGAPGAVRCSAVQTQVG